MKEWRKAKEDGKVHLFDMAKSFDPWTKGEPSALTECGKDYVFGTTTSEREGVGWGTWECGECYRLCVMEETRRKIKALKADLKEEEKYLEDVEKW